MRRLQKQGSCYNIGRNEIYYFNRDSLFVYNMETGNISAKAFTERCPVKLFLAGSFFDSASERYMSTRYIQRMGMRSL